jgi:hypothetical protein
MNTVKAQRIIRFEVYNTDDVPSGGWHLPNGLRMFAFGLHGQHLVPKT